MNGYKCYTFHVKYDDNNSTKKLERKVQVTAIAYLQAWIYCVQYMFDFLSGGLYRVNKIELITVDEL